MRRFWLPFLAPAIILFGFSAIPFAPRTVAAEESVTRAAITGTVVDGAGNPIQGTAVRIWYAWISIGSSPYCPSCWADCGKTATSDKAGRFAIESVDPQLEFRLLFIAKGYEPKFAGFDPQKHKPLTVTLKPRGKRPDNERQIVTGMVVDSHGKPVVGALVEPFGCKQGEERWWGELPGTDPLAVTDDQGRFEIVSAKAVEGFDLKVTARALSKKNFALVATAKHDNRLVLSEGAAVRGRVVEHGQAVAGVLVGLVQANRSAEDFLGAAEIGTNARGEFQFANVPPKQDFYVYGIMESLRDRGAVAARKIKVGADGSEITVGDLEVESGYQITGRLVRSDGKTLPLHTRIRFGRKNAWDSQIVETDADGTFKVRGLPAGVVEINATVEGCRLSKKNRSYAPLNGLMKGLVEKNIDGLLVLMDPGERKFDYGSGSSGFSRQVALTEQQLEHEPLAGVAAVAGGYETADESSNPPKPPDDESRMVYRPARRSKPLPKIKLPPPLPEPVSGDANVPKRPIVGRVVDQAGKSVAGADVWNPVVWAGKKGRLTVHSTTNSDGRFMLEFPIEWLPNNPSILNIGGTVWAYAPGHSIGMGSPLSQALPNMAELMPANEKPLEIHIGPPTDLKFTILSPDGDAVRGAHVGIQNYFHAEINVYDIPPPELIAKACGTTDITGQIALPAFEFKKTYRISVETPDLGTEILEPGAAGGPPTRLRLSSVGRLEGRVTAAQRELFREMYLVIETSDYGRPAAMGTATPDVDADGHFVVPHIAIGKVTLYAKLADGRLPVRPRLIERDKLSIAPDSTMRIEIPLEATLTVHGLIRIKRVDKPVAGAVISIRHGNDCLNETVSSDANGRYEAQVLPGKVNLQVIYIPSMEAMQTSESRSAKFDVPEGANGFEVPPLDLVQCRQINGRLLGRDGKPLANFTISAFAGKKLYRSTNTDEKGELSFWNVPDGVELDTYQVASVPPKNEPEVLAIESQNPLVLRLK